MEVIFLEPVYKDYIWGGTNLKTKLNKHSNYDKIAESWEISTNDNGKSLIRNGLYKGETLDKLFKDDRIKKDIFGSKLIEKKEFPILIKFIDAQNHLSVQVHPNDKFAKEYENSQGKSELWYIVDCKEKAKLICGIKKEINDVKEIFNNDNIENCLNFVDVKKGDYVYIEAGTVHAILEGIVICEIQQNSDITYRIYDWNRKDKNGNARELHKEKAIQVINKDIECKVRHSNDIKNNSLARNENFNIDLINVNGIYEDKSNKETFYAYNVVEGEGIVKTLENTYDVVIGDSFIIPACLGNYKINGKLKLLKTYI